jgi:hypothetical protein
MPFSMSKNGLCMWISAYPFVQNDVFFKVPYVLWIRDFVDMYVTHLGTRIWSPSIHTYSKKWFFLASKTLLYPLSIGEFIYFSTLNLMILQTVWNQCVRFGGHINIQVNYKIQWNPQFCTMCFSFNRGWFEAILDSTRPLMFRG